MKKNFTLVGRNSFRANCSAFSRFPAGKKAPGSVPVIQTILLLPNPFSPPA